MADEKQPQDANRPRFNEVEREIIDRAARAATRSVNAVVGQNHTPVRVEALRAFSHAHAFGEHVADNATSASHLGDGLIIMKAMLGAAAVGSYAIRNRVDEHHPEYEMIEMLQSAHQAGRTASTSTGDPLAETLGRTLAGQMQRVLSYHDNPDGCIKRMLAELAALVVICAQSMEMRNDMKLAAVGPGGEMVLIDATSLLDQIDAALAKADGHE